MDTELAQNIYWRPGKFNVGPIEYVLEGIRSNKLGSVGAFSHRIKIIPDFLFLTLS